MSYVHKQKSFVKGNVPLYHRAIAILFYGLFRLHKTQPEKIKVELLFRHR